MVIYTPSQVVALGRAQTAKRQADEEIERLRQQLGALTVQLIQLDHRREAELVAAMTDAALNAERGVRLEEQEKLRAERERALRRERERDERIGALEAELAAARATLAPPAAAELRTVRKQLGRALAALRHYAGATSWDKGGRHYQGGANGTLIAAETIRAVEEAIPEEQRVVDPDLAAEGWAAFDALPKYDGRRRPTRAGSKKRGWQQPQA